jgi:hypothetical protein
LKNEPAGRKIGNEKAGNIPWKEEQENKPGNSRVNRDRK